MARVLSTVGLMSLPNITLAVQELKLNITNLSK